MKNKGFVDTVKSQLRTSCRGVAGRQSCCYSCTIITHQILPAASTIFLGFMRRRLLYILISLLSLSIITLWWPVNDSDCNFEAFLASKTTRFQVHATKVIVQPWRGRHHVYGIFMIPDEYKQAPFFVLTVQGAGSYCSKQFGYKQNFDDIFPEPGTYLVKKPIRTRKTLRLILQGFYSQVNDKNNWTLTFPDAMPANHPKAVEPNSLSRQAAARTAATQGDGTAHSQQPSLRKSESQKACFPEKALSCCVMCCAAALDTIRDDGY